jgi:D-beta-D-heptose 7-phosphate kinase/D-beta-D-heptose 1-phosphate adenosyltransferase
MNDIRQILAAAPGKTILVLGDLMLDEWIIGDALRISPEAPVPVVRHRERKIAPGGAANVAMNLLSLGAKVHICGVVGDDESGRDVLASLQSAGAETSGIVLDHARPTTLKTRVLATRQQMLRIDRESDEVLDETTQNRLQDAVRRVLDESEVLCLSDYDKGLASGGVVAQAIHDARLKSKAVTAGPKPHNFACFADADFISLNEKEAGEAAGFKINSDEAAMRAGYALRERINAGHLAITRGGKGVLLFQNGTPPLAIGGHSVEVFDVAGAGDTFLAASTLALAAGAEYSRAAELGNLAAAASVRHVGVVAVTPEEVLKVHTEND